MERQHTPTGIRRRTLGALVAVSSLALLAACGDDEQSTDTAATETTMATETTAGTPTTDTTTDTTVTQGGITIYGEWARTSPMMASMGAAYLTITSDKDDKLTDVMVDPGIATTAEIHETYMVGSDTTTGMGSETTTGMGSGEMGMRPVEFIELPAGVAVELKPGGYHVMLIGLAAPLEVGTTIELTLVFETAGELTIEVPVLDEAP